MEAKRITVNQAVSLLKKGNFIHTFRCAGVVMGCDIDKNEIFKILSEHPTEIELSGATARAMKHGVCVNHGGYLFLETDEEMINKFDPQG